ncbi:type IV secretion system protein VirB3 [Sphingomonas sp. ASV193]|uniref:type IV secretion system protein VirB3 n=1 Tax=Sphingomonas sp. ASV193 TaxID=3144405 RepID=UPI0032E864E2
MRGLQQDRLFVALTRPQMFAGVSYSFFVLNLILSAELFLILRSLWVVVLAGLLHVTGMLLALREPRFLDLWLTRVSRCPRIKNYRFWQCQSYRP